MGLGGRAEEAAVSCWWRLLLPVLFQPDRLIGASIPDDKYEERFDGGSLFKVITAMGWPSDNDFTAFAMTLQSCHDGWRLDLGDYTTYIEARLRKFANAHGLTIPE